MKPVSPEHESSSDEVLLALFNEGDPSALEVLLLRREKWLWNVARKSIRDLSLAEEALQEAFATTGTAPEIFNTDQGSQFTSYEWQEFLEQHNLAPSMSRRANCWDNAVVESFFNLLKRERIRRRKYKTREEARQDVFDYIEFFYNPQRKHVRNGMLSPIDFEQQQKLKLQGV